MCVSSMEISWGDYLAWEVLRKQSSLSPSQEGKVFWELTNRSGRSDLAGMTHGSSIFMPCGLCFRVFKLVTPL